MILFSDVLAASGRHRFSRPGRRVWGFFSGLSGTAYRHGCRQSGSPGKTCLLRAFRQVLGANGNRHVGQGGTERSHCGIRVTRSGWCPRRRGEEARDHRPGAGTRKILQRRTAAPLAQLTNPPAFRRYPSAGQTFILMLCRCRSDGKRADSYYWAIRAGDVNRCSDSNPSLQRLSWAVCRTGTAGRSSN